MECPFSKYMPYYPNQLPTPCKVIRTFVFSSVKITSLVGFLYLLDLIERKKISKLWLTLFIINFIGETLDNGQKNNVFM